MTYHFKREMNKNIKKKNYFIVANSIRANNFLLSVCSTLCKGLCTAERVELKTQENILDYTKLQSSQNLALYGLLGKNGLPITQGTYLIGFRVLRKSSTITINLSK